MSKRFFDTDLWVNKPWFSGNRAMGDSGSYGAARVADSRCSANSGCFLLRSIRTRSIGRGRRDSVLCYHVLTYGMKGRPCFSKSPTGQHCTFPAVSTYGVGFSEKLLCFDAICGLEEL